VSSSGSKESGTEWEHYREWMNSSLLESERADGDETGCIRRAGLLLRLCNQTHGVRASASTDADESNTGAEDANDTIVSAFPWQRFARPP